MSGLDDKLTELGAAPALLVASDFDGTLAPIVDDPARAAPSPRAVASLWRLAQMPGTHVAIISGRALKALNQLAGWPANVTLIGSHGSEFDAGFAATLPGEVVALLTRVVAALHRIASTAPGFLVEPKPASVAFHYRNVTDHDADAALRRIVEGPASWPGVMTHHGKRVIELSVVQASKGAAITMLRRRIGAGAVIFLGDDETDENGFAVLSGSDAGIKVGPGPTRAQFRVNDVDGVARVLERLTALRAAQGVPARSTD